MSRHPEGLSQWAREVSNHLPHLKKRQVMVLAMYSFGMVMVRTCGISSISYFLGELLGEKENTVRQRLREITYDARDKRGKKRKTIDEKRCFAPLLKWVVAWWAPDEQRLALALDATTLGQRFTVLSISVLYRGCAIPVAWAVLPATQKGAWNPHWKRLLRAIHTAIPPEWTVIVLTDRGLYSKALYKAIQRNGWHPMMRINDQGKFRPLDHASFRPLKTLIPQPRSIWYGQVDCFVTPAARLRCTLLAHWDEGFGEPWLLLTDLPPDTADSLWYAMRMWIEHSFKDCKRGGFRWEHTKMTDPDRASRLWLVIALATLWAVCVGGEVDASLPPSCLSDVPSSTPSPRPRRLSCFNRGLIKILAALLRRAPVPFGRFIPEPWPSIPFARSTLLLLSQGGYCVIY